MYIYKNLHPLLAASILILCTTTHAGYKLQPAPLVERCTGQLGILHSFHPNAPIACVSSEGKYIADASKAPPHVPNQPAQPDSCGEFLVESEGRKRIAKIANISPGANGVAGQLYCGLLKGFVLSCSFTEPPTALPLQWRSDNIPRFPRIARLYDMINGNLKFDLRDDSVDGPKTLYSNAEGMLAIVCMKDIPVNEQGFARWKDAKIRDWGRVAEGS
ncbi:MAG: hypothetical protein M1829_005248 [Trizodia sp. TS-e1964]|nr:MAG: hypothetical protein M1829_005248 [Trizodia sp. TS-e1964]